MIKSKIDARERALELAVGISPKTEQGINALPLARAFEQYLIGDAELPEVVDDNAHLKELFEVAKREMEKINKRDDYNYDLMKAMHPEWAVTCKSEAE